MTVVDALTRKNWRRWTLVPLTGGADLANILEDIQNILHICTHPYVLLSEKRSRGGNTYSGTDWNNEDI
jgi:hypothetical protein